MDSASRPPSAAIEHSLISRLYILCSPRGIAGVFFRAEEYIQGAKKLAAVYRENASSALSDNISAFYRESVRQIREYLDGKRRVFDIPLDLSLTISPYQRLVLAEVMKITYGSSTTYGKIANFTGGTARSVGTANAKNPLSIIIPCHRVLGSGGRLCGYGGGIPVKEALLRLEANCLL